MSLKLPILLLLSVFLSISYSKEIDPFKSPNPNSEELEKAQKLRQSVIERSSKKIDDVQGYINNFVNESEDEFLVNWIRYTNGDLEKSKEKLINSLKWRHKNNIDNINDNWKPGAAFKKNFPYKISGFSKEGLPILYMPWGLYDVRTAIGDGKRTDVLKTVINCFEHALTLTNPKTGKKATNYYYIVDLNKFTLTQMASVRVVGTMAAATGLYESNYPFYPKASLIVNAPSYFTPFVNIIKSILTADAFNYVQVFSPDESSKWLTEFQRHVDLDQIPFEVGGTSTKEIPWEA